jgi:hypothetical protein
MDLLSDVFFVLFAWDVAELRPYAYASIAALVVRELKQSAQPTATHVDRCTSSQL